MRSRIGWMRSAVKPDNLAAALEAALRRFDGASPVIVNRSIIILARKTLIQRHDARHRMELPCWRSRRPKAQPASVATDSGRRGRDPAPSVYAAHADVGEVSGPSVSAHFGIAQHHRRRRARRAGLPATARRIPRSSSPSGANRGDDARAARSQLRNVCRNAGRAGRRRLRTGCSSRRVRRMRATYAPHRRESAACSRTRSARAPTTA